jgi:hypothetical protein
MKYHIIILSGLAIAHNIAINDELTLFIKYICVIIPIFADNTFINPIYQLSHE